MSEPSRSKRRWHRPLYLAVGWLCVLLGIIGVILPVMPGTIFLIAAAWCFSRSSPRFESWLVNHPRLGPEVLRWRRTGAIARRTKYIACGSMALSFVIVAATDAPPIALWLSGAGLLAAGSYVASRPEPDGDEVTRP
ncbi:YbaN family protein [Bosea sp. CS1GBMeth4]|uniref:YbaN family protein n=1 Tax=Bosea sp. CS1GBMeth4 TaxID=1892849 RepID=UPI00164691BE|nr:YbaN family protein [Bosea sp. CS1GBMeth4]